MFLAVTSQTWIITFLGFGMVLVLLFVFIYIMKLMGVIMNRVTKTNQPAAKQVAAPKGAKIKVADADELTRAAIAYSLAMADGDDEAAIAYSLHLYYNNAHDDVAPLMTMRAYRTQWNAKSFGINNLHR